METVTCKCTKKQCLLCKHSRTGDPCNKKNKEFTKSSFREISDKAIVYKIKEKYLNEEIEGISKSKNKGKKADALIKQLEKNLKETIKIKKQLEKEAEILKKELDEELIVDIKTIKIKDIEQ